MVDIQGDRERSRSHFVENITIMSRFIYTLFYKNVAFPAQADTNVANTNVLHVPFIDLSLASSLWLVQAFIVLLAGFAVYRKG